MAIIKCNDARKVHANVFKGRDFDKEARGKSRCLLYAAALQSPLATSLAKVKVLADEGMLYTFTDNPIAPGTTDTPDFDEGTMDAGVPTNEEDPNTEEPNPLDNL